MIVEAVGESFVYRWPGGEIRLERGKPIELPDERAKRLLAKAAGRVRVVAPIRPGDRIRWTRFDGYQEGVVDFRHVDPDGTCWAFVTVGSGWCAVNLKFAVKVTTTENVADWPADERERRAQVEQGRTVVANLKRDKRLIEWATAQGLARRIDRQTQWGNPFKIGPGITRDAVCEQYREYLNRTPALLSNVGSLRGLVLICHCFPERCHGSELIAAIDSCTGGGA